jgi:hypothetical protein
MRPRLSALVCLCGLAVLTAPAQDKKEPKKANVFTDPKEAGPDFLIQGEYEGTAGEVGKYGAQVVARGDGKFDVYVLAGGLPGAGWDTKTRTKAMAQTKDGKTTITGAWTGEIAEGRLVAKGTQDVSLTLKKVERKSPTQGQAPPAGAVVLFDGKDVSEWDGGKLVEGNLLMCGTRSKKGFGVGKLHIEFRTPFQPKAGGQGRGNSGVFIHGHEIQVLDSFGLEGKNNECGAFYGSRKPDVNMCLPPLSWQTYDVEVKPGEKEGDLLATVWHNGVKVHENYAIKGSANKPARIDLQNHGNPVVYRNIWIAPPSGTK